MSLRVLKLMSFISLILTNSGFLLQPTASTDASTGNSEKHFTMLLDLLLEERKARQQLEQSVTWLYRELANKTATSSCTCKPSTDKVVLLEQKVSNLEHNIEQLMNNYSHLSAKYNEISSRVTAVENGSIALHFEIRDLKKTSAINASKEIINLKANTDTLKEKFNLLFANQISRGQDVLALHNETLHLKRELSTAKSEMKTSLTEMSTHHNKSLDYVMEIARNSTGHGALYTRWLATECPNDSERVYTGIVGSGAWERSTFRGEPICLSQNPDFNRTASPFYGLAANLYFVTERYANQTNSAIAPCVVCRANVPSVVMIPGRSSCYPDWKLEYKGYMGSLNDNEKNAGAFVCIDASSPLKTYQIPPFTEILIQCNALFCSKYVNDNSVSCVVCSK